MNPNHKAPRAPCPSGSRLVGALLCAALLYLSAAGASAQVSPAEILNPQLKALEETYFPQLKALHQAIRATKFPLPFVLSRYVGLDPEKQSGTDTRALEFVKFHERAVLKITGNYNAAYNADPLTQNQRASRAFREVIVPLLELATREILADVGCDAIGFEIAYHVRRQTRNSDYEGKEILVVVLDRADAFGFLSAPNDQDRQEILNRSEIYVNGQDFGLALGERDPFNVEALGRPTPRPAAAPRPGPSAANVSGTRLLKTNQDPPPGFRALGAATPPAGTEKPEAQAAPASTPADAERLQAKYQPQLDALAKTGVASLQFVNYAPPSFAIFRNQIVLQLSLRNPLRFEKDTSSIYKRAAQSFDLFLAPQLKVLLEKLPADAEIQALDITLLNQLAAKPNPSSEALEFICPLKLLRQFVDAEITNQDLINQSVVLVNGVRIALNLQQVE
jgi:hypothetical protein